MSNFDHIIYKNDPVLLESYVNKLCTVTATDKSVHTGIVYTVDPVTESIVLIEEANTPEQRLKFVVGHAVQQVEVVSNDVENVPQIFPHQSSRHTSQSSIVERKKTVMNLLLENRLPVTEADDILQIEGVVSIEPPYAPENCVSTNPIVLTRIHNILSQLN